MNALSLGLALLIGIQLIWARPIDIRPDKPDPLPGMRILDQAWLTYDRIEQVPFSEISDLAWLPKKRTLMLLSDKGRLYRFTAEFNATSMHLQPIAAYRLRTKKGRHLTHAQHDSEGLTVDGSGHLVVSFEGKARVAYLSLHGKIKRKLPLPDLLKGSHRYSGKNKQLEAIAWHPRYGLLTAKERPPKGVAPDRQSLISLRGKVWHFRAESFPNDGVTAIEVMDDGNVLVLERALDRRNLLAVITLKKVYLDTEDKAGECQTEIIGQLRSDRGWLVDNFEGLARVGSHRYVMVSDDGGNFFQKTLLIYFEVR
jgi:hypothetical protein